MNCDDARAWLNALLDDELDAKNAAEMRAHLAACEPCTRRYRTLEALRDGLRRAGMHYDMPESLSRRISSLVSPGSTRPANSAFGAAAGRWAKWAGWPASAAARWVMWAGWPVAIAASALLVINTVQRSGDFRSEIVAAHVRSLLVDHLSDVASSDHHTVRPWFAGKIDFSPPVPDLSSQGFDLIGGRLEYLDHQLAAAIVYRRHAHFINLLVRSSRTRSPSLPRASVHGGYSLREWRASGLDFIAISDLEPAELELFQHAYESEQRS